jgi:acetate kinase
MATRPVLVLNSGSSSIKFSVYESSTSSCSEHRKIFEGAVDGIGVDPSQKLSKFWIKSYAEGQEGRKLTDETPPVGDVAAAWALIGNALAKPPFPRPAAIGHRMVCGGPTVTENQRLTPALIDEMERYTSFAPLHTPVAIFIMRQIVQEFPDVPNFVCLDSYFHRNLPEVTRQLPIPETYSAMGVRRFGAHGLSYESIVAHLQPNLPSRLIVAHLGNGSSVTAIRDGQSVDTSMGLTPTGGLISGSRTGDIDPGVLIFILRQLADKASSAGDAANQLEKIVNHESGLQGVSQLTNDMRALRDAIAKGNAKARLAVDEFVYVLRKYIGAYAVVLGGLDMLVFTGGIGQNDSATRAEVCAGLDSLGVALDPNRNQSQGETKISSEDSKVQVRVIPPAEDLMIVEHVCHLLAE